MEVWDLLRPSLRRLTAVAVAAVVAALGAVLVEHARAAQYDGRVSVYFAQALGVDTTSNSVDLTADQLTSIFQLPSVEAKGAATGGVPVQVVHDATLAHTSGSPIIDITATGSRQEATKAAPALAAAGLEYFAQQGVARAQSVQSSAIANLASINAELAAYTASAGVQDIDAAVAAAAAVSASATSGSTVAKAAAAANLARLQALQPQFDLLTTEVAGARTSVSQAYGAVGAAQGVAKVIQLPGNVVTAPVKPASRITAYLRAAVGAVVVVVLLGAGFLALTELRRRRLSEPEPAPDAGARAAPPLSGPAEAPVLSEATARDGPAVLAGDFPLLAATGVTVGAEPRDDGAASPTPSPTPSVAPSPATADAGAQSATDSYFAQAQRHARDVEKRADDARRTKKLELQHRALRDALQRVERADAGGSMPQQSRVLDDRPSSGSLSTFYPRFEDPASAEIEAPDSIANAVGDTPEVQPDTDS